MTKVVKREYLEIDDVFWRVDALRDLEPLERDALLEKALGSIQSQIKRVLCGLGPLVGRELLLRVCTAVIDEDFNADGYQTPLPEDGTA